MLDALELARTGQHRLFGGRVLVALSHQALHLGRTAEAADLASAALAGTQRLAPPAAVAMFSAMQACAAAAQGDRATSEAALSEAERALAQRPDGDEPPDWLDFDNGGLAGHAARAYRDLALPAQARVWAETAVAQCRADHSRTRAQRSAILATVLIQVGELEQAAHIATGVLTDARRLHSTHVINDVAKLVRLIDPSRSAAAFRFVRQARQLLAAQPVSSEITS